MGDAIISQARAAVGAALLRAREGEGGGAGQRRPLCWRRLREEHALSWGELLSLPEVQRHMGHDAASPPPAHLFGKVGESPSHPHPREREREREREDLVGSSGCSGNGARPIEGWTLVGAVRCDSDAVGVGVSR